MRTLLRHTGTGLYFAGPESWTTSPESALDFRFLERALRFAQIWELEEVEVAFVFEDSPFTSTLAVERIELGTAA